VDAGVIWNVEAALSEYTVVALLELLRNCKVKIDSLRGTPSFNGMLACLLSKAYLETLDNQTEGSIGNSNRNKKNEIISDPKLVTLVNDIKKRYKPDALNTNELRSAIENALTSVRTGKLYNKLAKFVGRINIGKYETATGTIIEWVGMNPSLKGKVVLTVAHNYYGSDKLDVIVDRKAHNAIEIGSFPTIVESPQNDDTLETKSDMSFMIDLSNNENDIVVYAPGTHNNSDDNNHKVVKVDKVYCMAQNNSTWVGEAIPDIAIFILEDSVLDAGAVLDADEFKNGQEYFSVGYGMAFIGGDDRTYYEKFIGGWNAKKATLPFVVEEKTDIRSDSPFPDAFSFMITPRDNTEMIHGNSDSGSPIVNKETNKIVAVLTGSAPVETAPLLGWIRAVGHHAAT
jgi:hypothetical protein